MVEVRDKVYREAAHCCEFTAIPKGSLEPGREDFIER